MKPLVIKRTVTVAAPPEKVWGVLTHPRFVKQWDDLPEGFDMNTPLLLGSEIFWEQPNGKATVLTVSQCRPAELLVIKLYNTSWEKPADAYTVGYRYSLSRDGQHTRLEVEIGDFSELPNGQDYFDNSLDFAETGTAKIKELSESSSQK